MWFCDIEGQPCSRNTLFVTHVDRAAKLHLLKQRLRSADMGICMSRMTVRDLVGQGIPSEKLCYVTPAHDALIEPRRIVIGITSRLRVDGAKREDILVEVCRRMRLDAYHFEIIGRGWASVVRVLEAAGATVRYYPGGDDRVADYQYNLERVPSFDYYLYLGFDEGSMGLLDALAAGIPTIVTPQGFHLDIGGGITHAFSNPGQLSSILRKIPQERDQRVASVARLSWSEYARKHAVIWRTILGGGSEELKELQQDSSYGIPLPELPVRQRFASGMYAGAYRNSAALREDFCMLWQWYTGTKFENTRLFHTARFIKRLVLSSGGHRSVGSSE